MGRIQDDDNFSAILLEADLEQDYLEFASFCRDLLKGLRKQAFKHLDVFLDQTLDWEFHKKLQFVIWICDWAEKAENHHHILVHPLLVKLIKPVLNEWIAQKPNDSRPYRWRGAFLANLQNDNDINPYEDFRKAIEVNSDDERAKVRLADLILYSFWYATHHLPDFYIGDPDKDFEELKLILSLIDSIADIEIRGELRNNIDSYALLLGDWLSFKKESGADFADWCEKHNRKYRWVKAYYYEK